ncbi:MAG: C40 family peptidase [Clostridia bacterium]|nr:C40 family peptidase [Clostridia bacterium]
MKRFFKRFTCLILCLAALAGSGAAEVKRTAELDVALSFLEPNNDFLKRYNALTGAGIEAVFEAGTPYLFGGKYSPRMFERAPAYSKRIAYTDTDFFRNGQVYLFGFDCSGFIQYIDMQTGKQKLPPLSTILYAASHHTSPKVVVTSADAPRLKRLRRQLEPGDLFVIRTKYNHVMMYIGTLRDYGLGRDNPRLKPYLDYPLCVHCGLSPMYGQRMTNWLRKHRDDEYYNYVNIPDGGVCVSILGVPEQAAEHYRSVQGNWYAWFVIGTTVVTVYGLEGREWCVYRE